MLTLTDVPLFWRAREAVSRSRDTPKADWPLMSDVGSFRAGVPEALIHWRRAKGEPPPKPMV